MQLSENSETGFAATTVPQTKACLSSVNNELFESNPPAHLMQRRDAGP